MPGCCGAATVRCTPSFGGPIEWHGCWAVWGTRLHPCLRTKPSTWRRCRVTSGWTTAACPCWRTPSTRGCLLASAGWTAPSPHSSRRARPLPRNLSDLTLWSAMWSCPACWMPCPQTATREATAATATPTSAWTRMNCHQSCPGRRPTHSDCAMGRSWRPSIAPCERALAQCTLAQRARALRQRCAGCSQSKQSLPTPTQSLSTVPSW